MVKHGGFRLSLPGFLAPSLGRDRTCCASLSSMHETYRNITIEYCPQLYFYYNPYILMCIYLVGGLEHLEYFSIYWECHNPN
jgi:hypothetical protein